MKTQPRLPSPTAVRPTLVEGAALAATFGLVALTCFLTLTKASGPTLSISNVDKLYHMLAFAGIVLPCALFYKRSLIWLVPGLIGFGAAIELIQPFVGRDGDWVDFLADVVGIGLGVGVAFVARIRPSGQIRTKR